MKFKTEILEMARIACASIPDTIVDEMDVSDEYFLEIRDYIHEQTKHLDNAINKYARAWELPEATPEHD